MHHTNAHVMRKFYFFSLNRADGLRTSEASGDLDPSVRAPSLRSDAYKSYNYPYKFVALTFVTGPSPSSFAFSPTPSPSFSSSSLSIT